MAELLINGKDALSEWGVRMGAGFLDALGCPVPTKPLIENKSRLEHGKRVIIDGVKVDERDLTLPFTIQGRSKADYQSKKKAFLSELYKGAVSISVPDNSSDVYKLTYTGKNVTYGQCKNRMFGKMSAKFNEPDPTDRG